ncbi:MAG TPA: hypothetical protein VGN57_19315 [Pirellulaceae bacterium]|jgi:hypothetical protein|nr:hypothetical protein [Pirellulaceae bacterium]
MFIASCPECGDSLTFPSGVALSSRCRCPLCTETFTLEECLSELPPMAELVDGDAGGGGFSPAFGGGGTALATAPRTATATSPRVGAGTRTAGGRAPARKTKGGNPLLQMAQIVIGGAVGVGLAVLIIWWGLGKDPFSLAPTVAEYAPFLVPAKFRTDAQPVSVQTQKPAGANQQPEPLQKDASGAIKLDGSRFGLDEERPQPGAGRGTRSSLDPDSGELSEEPVVDTLIQEFDGGGALGGGFGSPFEEPALDSFALPDAELAPAAGLDFQEGLGEPGAFAPEPLVEEPMAEEPEEGAFNLEPFSADPGSVDEGTGDAFAADPFSGEVAPADATAATGDPFALVFPSATEDLADVAAAEAEAWEAYSAAKGEAGTVRKEAAQRHYDQLAALAEVIAGLPPAPRSNAAASDVIDGIATRLAAPEERQVVNYLARTRLTEADFGLAGVVVAGRVEKVVPEGELAVVTLTLEQGANEQTKRVLAVVRESRGIPEQGSTVVALGVRHAGPAETLPASLAEEKAPIILAGAVVPVGGDPAAEAPAVEETPTPDPSATEPAPSEPSEPEPTPTEPSGGEPMAEEDAPAEPSGEAPAPAEEPAPAGPAPAETAPGEPGAEEPEEEPAPAEPAPTEKASGEEPAPSAGS